MEHPTAERPRRLRLACYTFGADGTGYPRHLVTHHCRAQLGDIPERGPPEALDRSPFDWSRGLGTCGGARRSLHIGEYGRQFVRN